jgi:hypothetical protein
MGGAMSCHFWDVLAWFALLANSTSIVYAAAEDGFSSGSSPAHIKMSGTIIFGTSAVIEIELGGTTLGTEYDHIEVNGHLAMGGTLQLLLINGFTPDAGDTFNIFDWTTQSGTFAHLNLPSLGSSLAWNASQLYVDGTLSVAAAGLPGDFNFDGAVNAADYVMWRKGLAGPPTNYDLWVSNFGRTNQCGSMAACGWAVPEPAAWFVVAALILGAQAPALADRQRRPRRQNRLRRSLRWHSFW